MAVKATEHAGYHHLPRLRSDSSALVVMSTLSQRRWGVVRHLMLTCRLQSGTRSWEPAELGGSLRRCNKIRPSPSTATADAAATSEFG